MGNDSLSTLSLLFGFFSGIGSVYLDEGLYSYIGVEERNLKFSNADDYFAHPMIKVKDCAIRVIRFSSFIGALIAYLVTPSVFQPGQGDDLATIIPSVTLAGLMVLVTVPPPNRNLGKPGSSKRKEKHQYDSNYTRAEKGSIFSSTWEMMASCMRFETIFLFWFIYMRATLISLIESSWMLMMFNVTGFHLES
jgi:hypothetical protein